ncbi:hypothetical protein VMCG_10141 [Cytospora schulzeri]|uniref:F-box domain-containing protein n=1 Tax=Cytospora schulzeri TaxID=448051 RepID=A0A423VDC2_9PEZI|nr:hypothetical protein VMCG_10141 [Valsa malicola]
MQPESPGAVAMATTTITITSLPTEMLSHIFSFLDTPSPSDLRLHDQPHAHMLKNPEISSQYLKNLSLVSKQWRAIVLPLLFRHLVWYLDRFDLMQIEQSKSDPDAIPLRSFVQVNNLTPYINTLTLVVVKNPRGRTAHGDAALYRQGDGSGYYAYSPDPLGPMTRAGAERDMVFNEDSNWFWDLIFAVIDPLRFTLVASPRMLASLLARMLFLGDEWSFDQSHHILSLSRPSRKSNPRADTQFDPQTDTIEAETALSSASASASASAPPSSRASRRVPCALFTIRPWNALLLNEGSSTRVYKTYEYFHKRPPSMLGALLGAEEFPNNESLIPPSIRDLAYVGIFPLSSHFNTLVQNLPPIDRLFVQLVPRNDILNDKREMQHLDMDDLWAERNTSYAKIMPKLFDSSSSAGNWRQLQEFESGDAADRESWDMAVEYVRQFGAEWRVEREGVFIKRQPGEEDKRFDEANKGGHHSTMMPPFHGYNEDDGVVNEPGSVFFRGALRRFAFAGVTRLPLSSVWLYLQNTNP